MSIGGLIVRRNMASYSGNGSVIGHGKGLQPGIIKVVDL
jgi:hypothetical protein